MKLYWEDIQNKKYCLGILSKENEEYIFEINEDGLKDAVKHGCFGIGNIDITKKINRSKELFQFFKSRIPTKEHIDIDNILDAYDIVEYDEFELLRKTNGRLITDRYFVLDI